VHAGCTQGARRVHAGCTQGMTVPSVRARAAAARA
jgi:hypothetical protein